MQKNYFANPSVLYEFCDPEDRFYFRCYPILNRKFGVVPGTLLSYLLHQQWQIECNPKTKARFPHFFQSEKQLAYKLGFSKKATRKALNCLREIKVIQTIPKGSPPKNNFFFDQQRIMDILLGEDSLISHTGDESSSNT